MSPRLKQLALVAVLVEFTALSAWLFSGYGSLAEVWASLTGSGLAIQLFVDLCIALTIVMVWMVKDARAHGINPAPYVVLTVCTGSIGPILYLIRRVGRAPDPAAAARDDGSAALAA